LLSGGPALLDAMVATSGHSPVFVLEAMACGVPVIAPKAGSMPELLEDGVTGFLCPELDAANVLGKVSALRSNPELSARMRQDARRFIESERDERVALAKIDFPDLYHHAARYYIRRPNHEQISRRAFQAVLALRNLFG
jgi:glycosyltransferase involved in cell wall biosynthesis